jgi:hypothetical protein
MDFSIKIENNSDKMYYEERYPNQKKVKLNKPEHTVNLKWQSRMKFVFYSEDNQHSKEQATYSYFKINDPCDHVKIEIKKDSNSKELETVIEWPKNGKQKSKDLFPPYTPDNVNVGVKE